MRNCDDRTAHGPHGWYRWALRLECPGVAAIDWDSVPLIGACSHGVGMLDACDDCEADQRTPEVPC